MNNCQTCGKPAPFVIVTDQGDCPLCAEHYEMYWNTIPNILAGLVILMLEKITTKGE